MPLALKAAPFSSFQENKVYLGDGRWLKNGDSYLFRLNEGNANEENIVFNKNSLDLDHQVKVRLCFKIKKDCHLNCKGDLIKTVSLLKPWEKPAVWIPNPEGSYPPSETECQ